MARQSSDSTHPGVKSAPAAGATDRRGNPTSPSSPADSPAVARRRVREKRVVSQMIALYCEKHHDPATRTEVAHCGEPVCAECAAVDAYAVLRTEKCRTLAAGTKTSCDQCPHHCYRPEERAKIREVMRFSGPRMLTRHPVAAVRHLLGK